MANFDENTKIWKIESIPYSYLPDYMVSDLMFEELSKDPKRIFQICADDGTKLTAEELKISSIRVAQNLMKSDVRPNDVVCLITHQSHMTTILISGVIFCGALINPLDSQFDEKDIRVVCENLKPKIIICDPEAIPKIQKSLNEVKFVYSIYSTASASEESNFLKTVDLLKPTGNEESFKPFKFEEKSDEKILAILCTSGSTGEMKN